MVKRAAATHSSDGLDDPEYEPEATHRKTGSGKSKALGLKHDQLKSQHNSQLLKQQRSHVTPVGAAGNGRTEEELLALDPKKIKRILANRQSAAKSKERKAALCNELDQRWAVVQQEADRLDALHSSLAQDVQALRTYNSGLAQEVAELQARLSQLNTTQAVLVKEMAHAQQVLNLTHGLPTPPLPRPAQPRPLPALRLPLDLPPGALSAPVCTNAINSPLILEGGQVVTDLTSSAPNPVRLSAPGLEPVKEERGERNSGKVARTLAQGSQQGAGGPALMRPGVMSNDGAARPVVTLQQHGRAGMSPTVLADMALAAQFSNQQPSLELQPGDSLSGLQFSALQLDQRQQQELQQRASMSGLQFATLQQQRQRQQEEELQQRASLSGLHFSGLQLGLPQQPLEQRVSVNGQQQSPLWQQQSQQQLLQARLSGHQLAMQQQQLQVLEARLSGQQLTVQQQQLQQQQPQDTRFSGQHSSVQECRSSNHQQQPILQGAGTAFFSMGTVRMSGSGSRSGGAGAAPGSYSANGTGPASGTPAGAVGMVSAGPASGTGGGLASRFAGGPVRIGNLPGGPGSGGGSSASPLLRMHQQQQQEAAAGFATAPDLYGRDFSMTQLTTGTHGSQLHDFQPHGSQPQQQQEWKRHAVTGDTLPTALSGRRPNETGESPHHLSSTQHGTGGLPGLQGERMHLETGELPPFDWGILTDASVAQTPSVGNPQQQQQLQQQQQRTPFSQRVAAVEMQGLHAMQQQQQQQGLQPQGLSFSGQQPQGLGMVSLLPNAGPPGSIHGDGNTGWQAGQAGPGTGGSDQAFPEQTWTQ